MAKYGELLMNRFVKIGVLIFTAILLAFGIYGTVHTSLDFDYKLSGSSKSAYVNWIETLEDYFPFGVFQMDVVLDDPNVDYTDPKIQEIIKSLDTLPSSITELDGSKTINWMSSYSSWSTKQSVSIAGDDFYENLPAFLEKFKDFQADLVWQNNSSGKITASRIHLFTKDRASWLFRKNALVDLREALKTRFSLPFYPVSFAFIYLSHLIVIVKATLTNLGICSAVILFLTLPFVVQPKVSLVLLLTFVCFLLELFGCMMVFDLSLNSVTMIVIVMAVGFAVDYSCHVVHAYLVSKETTPDSRMVDAISNIGVVF